eukprot:GHVL01039753.1.p1 GENE.GHVL01039753.1~~GHVL01039753.1.p1  ORF type:complete len:382 (+),score=61.61 GHVL01039753.1:15-1160(+)
MSRRFSIRLEKIDSLLDSGLCLHFSCHDSLIELLIKTTNMLGFHIREMSMHSKDSTSSGMILLDYPNDAHKNEQNCNDSRSDLSSALKKRVCEVLHDAIEDTRITGCRCLIKTEHPRIFIVGRRHLRKNKFINFVGDYHIELIQEYGGLPILIPRSIHSLASLEMYFPMHGLIIAEGEDIGPDIARHGEINKPIETIDHFMKFHDCESDDIRDKLEVELLNKALLFNIPFLGICRGAQLLNIVLGGSIYYDITAEIPNSNIHIDYNNYDNNRHLIQIYPDTPLHIWYKNDMNIIGDIGYINVNSYHHQGIKDLAPDLNIMGVSSDGLVEAVYRDYSPQEGKFCAGFQFHPERMLNDYNGNRKVFDDFLRACYNFKEKCCTN